MDKMTTLDVLHEKYRNLTQRLIATKTTITTMESCTSGFIASLITDTEGSSAIMKGAFVTYSNEAKIMNGVDAAVIQKYGVYSEQTAAAMADAAAKNYQAHIGIGVTGTFSNVDPDNADSVPGTVYACVVYKAERKTEKITLPVNISRFESKIVVADYVCGMIGSLISL